MASWTTTSLPLRPLNVTRSVEGIVEQLTSFADTFNALADKLRELTKFDTETNTVSILYPLNHAYWGIIDNLSGQNLIDYSVHATVKPTDKLTATLERQAEAFDRLVAAIEKLAVK